MPYGVLRRRIAWNLQLYRYVHDLTQTEAAARMDYSFKYFGNIEQQKRNLTLHSVERLAEGLQVDPLDLQQPVPPETRGRGRWVTISIESEADDALLGVVRALIGLGVVVSIRVLDGRVLEGIPVGVTDEQICCARWDAANARQHELLFTVDVCDVTGIAVR